MMGAVMLKVARSVAAILLLLVGGVAFAVLLFPKLFGWGAYVVTSGSMEPTFDTGSVVVGSPVDPGDVAVGDIVTFRDPAGYTTHRVIGMESASIAGEESTSFTTKGDANEDADPTTLDPRNVVGEAEFAVPHLGYLVEFVKTPLGAGALAALFLFVMFSGGSTKPESKDVADGAEQLEAVSAA